MRRRVSKPGSIGKTTQKSSEKSSEKILAAITSTHDISARQIAEAIGIPASPVLLTVTNNMVLL